MENSFGKYITFSSADFALDDSFICWVLEPDEERNLFWQAFLQANPSQIDNVEAVRKIILSFDDSTEVVPEEIKQKIWDNILREGGRKEGRIVGLGLRQWLTAAAVILFLGFGTWFLMNNKNNSTEVVQQKTEDDILPGGNKAVLTLADGTRVILDATDTGAISEQGGVTVIKLDDGELSYQKNKSANEAVVYNTISTPRGGQYQLTLSDGTKVWLNAESSLRYPTAFAGNDRKVELTGEGYFEVAHNAEKPFKVEARGMDVKVLGTHFNVNAYGDDSQIKTTLLEGSVEVSAAGNKMKIQPGEQALLLIVDQNLVTTKDVDLDQVVAWKEGYFSFQDASLKDVMMQLSRWYDVEVYYEGNIRPRNFGGGISRNANLSDALKILKESDINFKLEGRKLIVTQ